MKDLEDWAAVQKVYKQTKSKRATAKWCPLRIGISSFWSRDITSMESFSVVRRRKTLQI
ncbi:hypothetical protein [Muricomes intestini]|uniref:hypothetical protein n=1 Tax=Muricomes intestini TaxID=1796634 RepID=UPI002FE415EA